jgi:hypothetical protein
MSDNRFGFFKNKSDAGVTDPFVAYPTWPNLPNVSFYSGFANNMTSQANISFSTGPELGSSANANNMISVSTVQGNILFTDFSANGWVYDYNTGNVQQIVLTVNDPPGLGPFDRSSKGRAFTGGPFDSNGNVHILNDGRNRVIQVEVMYEYDVSANVLQYHYVGPADPRGIVAGSWGGSDFLGAGGMATMANNTVLCALHKNFQGGSTQDARTDQKYQLYYPETKQMSNTALEYPNQQIFSGNIQNDCSTLVLPDITETNNANVFFIPGLGTALGSYGDINLPANSNQACIFEANITTGDVTEHVPANLSHAFNRTPDGGSFVNRSIFSVGLYGADKQIYCFPGEYDAIARTSPWDPRTNGIMKMDPTDVANTTMSAFGLWDDSANSNIMLSGSTNAFLGTDGYIHWQMYESTPGFNSGTYLYSLDTNPTSPTYNTGYKQLNATRFVDTYDVTAYEGSSTSSSGYDEITINTSVDLSRSTGTYTQLATGALANTTNSDLTNLNGQSYYLRKITTTKYNLQESNGAFLAQSIGSEDPAGMTVTIDIEAIHPSDHATNFTGNGDRVVKPNFTYAEGKTFNHNITGTPIYIFNVSGTGTYKTNYATWNMHRFYTKNFFG